ncbi:hypothetical protein TREES_T100021500 [Tupaia chinensis]|uniref:Uncharacterized protein n=1 Tax=Tupaia chinensis TaxID=246437 RepID=L9KMH7_TUPCH|nr:hypothetical protein TREES_T100021500 [Tupaia chinensis]
MPLGPEHPEEPTFDVVFSKHSCCLLDLNHESSCPSAEPPAAGEGGDGLLAIRLLSSPSVSGDISRDKLLKGGGQLLPLGSRCSHTEPPRDTDNTRDPRWGISLRPGGPGSGPAGGVSQQMQVGTMALPSTVLDKPGVPLAPMQDPVHPRVTIRPQDQTDSRGCALQGSPCRRHTKTVVPGPSALLWEAQTERLSETIVPSCWVLRPGRGHSQRLCL